VFILEGVNMQAAANINPDQNDYGRYQNIQQSLLLRFGIAAAWFFILGVTQVGLNARVLLLNGASHRSY